MPRDFLQPWAEPLVLFRFRFRDPMSGNWVRARYAAERAQIAARYAEWETLGAPELRPRAGTTFSPWRNATLLTARDAVAGHAVALRKTCAGEIIGTKPDAVSRSSHSDAHGRR